MVLSRAGILMIAAMATALPLAAAASDGGMGGLGIPNARGPAYDPNKEFHAGIAALGDGKFRAAKEDFEHVLAMVPDQPVALSMLGQSEAGLGDLKGAARDYEAALRADPKQVIPARELAITDEKLGRHDRAVNQLLKLKAQDQACNHACLEAGDLDAAISAVEAVMSSSNQAAAAPPRTPPS